MVTDKEKNELKKEYLNSYREMYRKLEALTEQEEEIRESMTGIHGQDMNGMPKSKNKSDISNEIIRREAILEKIDIVKKDMLECQGKIMTSIVNVQDGVQSRILWLRYIKFMDWIDICEEIKYSWNQTHRLHSKALKALEIFE